MGLLNLFPQKNNLGIDRAISIEGGFLDDGKNRFLLQNCILAGVKSDGRDAALGNLIADALDGGKSVFVIQNGTAMPRNTLKKLFLAGWGNRRLFDADFCGGGFTQSVNFFKGSSIEFVQELTLLLLEGYGYDDEIKSFAERYLTEILQTYKINPQKKFSLQTIGDFDEAWLVAEATRLRGLGLLSAAEKTRIQQYVKSLSSQSTRLQAYKRFCADLQKGNFARSLSGNISYSQLNTDGLINFITLDETDNAKQSRAFLRFFVRKATEHISASVPAVFIFEDVDFAAVPELEGLLKACQGAKGSGCYCACSSSLDFKRLSYDPRAYCNAYFVFKQQRADEAEEWTKFFSDKKDKEGEEEGGLFAPLVNLFTRNDEKCDVNPADFMKLSARRCIVVVDTPSGEPYVVKINTDVLKQNVQLYANAAKLAQDNAELAVICKKMDVADEIFLGKVDLWFAKKALSTVYRTLKRFPALRKDVHYFGTLNGFINHKEDVFLAVNGPAAKSVSIMMKNATDSLALSCRSSFEQMGLALAFHVMAGPFTFSGIILNGKSLNQQDLLQDLAYGEKVGHSPVGCNSVKSIVDHELGHMLDQLLGISACAEFKKILCGYDTDAIGEKVSKYCVASGSINEREVVAEAYAEYCNNPAPREIAQAVGRLIEKRYREKFDGN